MESAFDRLTNPAALPDGDTVPAFPLLRLAAAEATLDSLLLGLDEDKYARFIEVVTQAIADAALGDAQKTIGILAGIAVIDTCRQEMPEPDLAEAMVVLALRRLRPFQALS
jgi:hypothetical protein